MKEYLFKDIVIGKEGLLKGPFGSDLKKSLYVPKGKNTYKVYLQENILNQTLDAGSHYISEEYYTSKMSRYAVKEKDFIVTCDGTLGEIYQLVGLKEKGIISSSLLRITINPELVDYDYFYYLFKALIKKELITQGNNSVLKHLPGVEVIRNHKIRLPDLTEQRKIGSVLKQIDKKIIINSKIISELKGLTRSIYEQWFLQYQIPDLNADLVFSKELGRKIPNIWNAKKLEDIVMLYLGGTPSTKNDNYWNGDINWLNSGEVSNFPVVESELCITSEGMNNSATKLLPKNTTVVSITGNIRCSITAIETCANQSVVGILENNTWHTSYLFQIINDLLNKYTKVSTGNCQQHINKKTIEESFVLIPSDFYLGKYYELVDPMYKRILAVGLENRRLTQLRDELLPLLMNGQVIAK